MYFIAEISSNHNQDIKTAMRLVKSAKQSGANAVKVQVYTPECLTVDSGLNDFKIQSGIWKGYTYHELYKKSMIPWCFVKPLMDYAKELSIDFIGTPYSYKGLAYLKELKVQNYKVSSFESNWIEFTRDVILQSKLFRGMSFISRNNTEAPVYIDSNVVNLWAISNYPSNLYIKPDYGKSPYLGRWGLSCHSKSVIPSVLATYDKASVIEKHIRLDNPAPTGYGFDYSFSLTPIEYKELVSVVSEAELIINNGYDYKPEQHSRSVRVTKNIKAGDVLTVNNIGIIRPGGIISPEDYYNVLGCIAEHDYDKGSDI